MIKYLTISGLSVTNPDLPSITLTPEGQAIGHVPGWNTMIDPDYTTGGSAINRAQRDNIMSPAVPWAGSNFSTFPNAETAFNVLDVTGSIQYSPKSTVDMNPDEFTIFAVVSNTLSSPTTSASLLRPVDVTTSGNSPRLGINTSGTIAFYNTNASVTRASIASAFPDANPILIMVTFSTTDGIKMYKNGVLGSSNPADVAPLDEKYNADDFYIMRNKQSAGSSMKVGMLGILDVDLGKAENSGYRRHIESFLMSKYGIS